MHVLADVLAEHGPDAAPHRRDREVRARHVLLQRRRRGAQGGRDARARPEPEGRHLRPEARDERARGHRRAGRGHRARTPPTSTSSTTRTATWSATPGDFDGGGRGGRGGRRGRRARSSRRSASGAAWRSSPPTTATPRRWSTATERTPFTAHTLDPVPLVVVADGVSRAARRAASSPTSRRRCSTSSASTTPAEWTGRSLLLY